MREIKFRAWHTEHKTMVNGTTGWLTIWDGGFSYRDKCGYSENENLILMQFTGLHDKNGEEIYEGDVVMFEWGHFYGHPNIVTPIKWEDAGWHPFLLEWRDNTGEFVSENATVIGNIYENPELLK